MKPEPVKYDPAIIIEFAERLYSQASSLIALYTIFGSLLGGAGGGFAVLSLHGDGPGLPIFFLIVGGLLGFAMGRARAFALRLQAQIALCQVQIEANTRGGTSSARMVA